MVALPAGSKATNRRTVLMARTPPTLALEAARAVALGTAPTPALGASPPTRFWLRTSGFWEKLGSRVSNRFAGGVLIVEVSKQVPAPPRNGLPEAFRRPLRVLDGIATPGPKPV